MALSELVQNQLKLNLPNVPFLTQNFNKQYDNTEGTKCTKDCADLLNA